MKEDLVSTFTPSQKTMFENLIVYLSKREFIPFRERLLGDEPNIAKYQEDMFIDENGVFHVLMYCCIQCDVMILVYSEGEKYAKYCSLKCNGGEQVEKRYTTANRYKSIK